MAARNPEEATPFQMLVYEAVKGIPSGKVISYGALASVVGCRSARVVGQALRKCPFDDVPCHRVIAAGRLLGGYGGNPSGPDVRKKKRLLQAEGVRFDNAGRVEAEFELRDSPGLRRLLRA
jgi:methylated-DNA-[protein]-cysteine S-methyltransferase